MKVLHALTTFLHISENWIYPQVQAVPEIQPGVFCTHLINEDLFPLDGAPLFRDPPPWSDRLGLPRLVNSIAFRLGRRQFIAERAVRHWQPALIHAHFGARGWDMLPVARELGVPLVTSFYGVDAWQYPEQSPLWRKQLHQLFAKGSLFLAEGPAMAERLCALGCPAAKARVNRLGVDLAAITFVERGFTPPLEVVMMALYVEKKGLPDGLRACAEAIRAGAPLRVTIIGDSTDEPGHEIKRDLESVAAAEPLRGRVTFTGFLKPAEARAILSRAHIFLCPSKHSRDGDAEGGSPLSLTEAMANGLLCIGTRHCDIPEVILDGKTGWLCESGDIDGLARALLEAATHSAALPELCRAGRVHIESKFSVGAMCDALGSIYRGLAG